MRLHGSEHCRRLILDTVATVFVGCTVESPVTPSALETIGGLHRQHPRSFDDVRDDVPFGVGAVQ